MERGPRVRYDGTMTTNPSESSRPASRDPFASEVVDRVRQAGNVWKLSGGELRLPGVFGFCSGVKRALTMLQRAVRPADPAEREQAERQRFWLLGQIIHNPWVNEYFEDLGVHILSAGQIENPAECIRADDCAVIPAFGVKLPVENQLREIGCKIVDTSCGDVRRLWAWAHKAAGQGFGVLIFGRADHDETVVTKSRLDAAGGKYVVAGNLDQTRLLCDLITGRAEPERFGEAFGPQATNAADLAPFQRLAQVSQTTMLYDDTLAVRDSVRERVRRAVRRGPGREAADVPADRVPRDAGPPDGGRGTLPRGLRPGGGGRRVRLVEHASPLRARSVVRAGVVHRVGRGHPIGRGDRDVRPEDGPARRGRLAADETPADHRRPGRRVQPGSRRRRSAGKTGGLFDVIKGMEGWNGPSFL